MTIQDTRDGIGTAPAAPPAAPGGPLTGRAVGDSILKAAAYTDPAVFQAEVGSIFSDRWVWAGFAHWVAEPGSVRPITVAGRPLLLTRDRAGELRVFHNACRHRGLLLCQEAGAQRRLRCPYHAWTYDLDGALRQAPYWARTSGSSPDEDSRARLGLLHVPHTEWAGMILVHLGEPDVSADDLLAPLRERWAGLALDRLHLAAERRFDVPANWKLVVENFLDFYHLPFIHPQVGPASVALDVDDLVVASDIIGGCYPHGAAGKAQKTSTPLPTLGDVPPEWLERQDIFCVFPNALVFLEADWFQVIGFEPVAVDRTVEHMAVFVAPSAAGDEYTEAREALCDVLFGVNEQDLPILAGLQRGRTSPATDHNHLLPHWDQITGRFQTLVAEAVTGEAPKGEAGRRD